MTRNRIFGRVAAAALALLVGEIAAAQEADGFRFSGVQRTRYESLENQFRAGFDDSDRVLALQTGLLFDWRRGDIEVLAQIMDSGAEKRRTLVLEGTITNALEPIQAYVGLRLGDGTLRVGRITRCRRAGARRSKPSCSAANRAAP